MLTTLQADLKHNFLTMLLNLEKIFNKKLLHRLYPFFKNF